MSASAIAMMPSDPQSRSDITNDHGSLNIFRRHATNKRGDPRNRHDSNHDESPWGCDRSVSPLDKDRLNLAGSVPRGWNRWRQLNGPLNRIVSLAWGLVSS
jgi:hypothetical protein